MTKAKRKKGSDTSFADDRVLDQMVAAQATDAYKYATRAKLAAQQWAQFVDSNGPAVGLLAAGAIKLCAAAFPGAIGAKLLIEQKKGSDVEVLLPVTGELVAAGDAVAATKPTPAQMRASLSGWWARTLEEISWLQAELGSNTGAFASAIPPDRRHDLSTLLDAVWHRMVRPTDLTVDTPAEFAGLDFTPAVAESAERNRPLRAARK